MAVKKYAFVGSHGLGKSSGALHLAATLKERYRNKSIKILEENVRELAKLFNNKINTPDFQRLCMVDHLAKELAAEQVYDIVVCDRTAIDTLIYGLVFGIKLPPEYFSLAINHLNTFDNIFFIRPSNDSTEIVDDGFRNVDISLRNKVDDEFERMLKLWGGKYTEVRQNEIYDFPYIQRSEA